ncbi:flavin reductase family protein [Streptomyces sp. NPDC005917]|uniref:flavin reductase family protein n=1 Tax=unclassified Streptomyces TaxID=2593676 RepID=UPI0033CD68B3
MRADHFLTQRQFNNLTQRALDALRCAAEMNMLNSPREPSKNEEPEISVESLVLHATDNRVGHITLNRPAWPRIARAGVFCVNVLGAGHGELCRAFAVCGADKFAGVAYDAAPVSGAPRLGGAAWIDCAIHAVHTGGDHLIVAGRVDALGAAEAPGGPLLFHRGRFAGLGGLGRFGLDG